MKTEPKFTPGPWAFQMVPDNAAERAGVEECTGFFLGPQGDDFRILRTFLEGGFVDEPAIANAQLITAAPLLYTAGAALLEAAEKHIFSTECEAERKAMRDALAEARGVSRYCTSTKSIDGGSCSERVPCDGEVHLDGTSTGGCGEPCSFWMD